jgi:hypothetical protein
LDFKVASCGLMKPGISGGLAPLTGRELSVRLAITLGTQHLGTRYLPSSNFVQQGTPETDTHSPKKEIAMPRDKEGHGVVLDDKGQEQPADKNRAQTANKTEPGHMPPQKPTKDDELQPTGGEERLLKVTVV